ncbi:uncharacterized protein EV420DRAFT_218594 [Desarmillaria tabescens]|uniref:Uncharacterized protein n=1 Tax=Armillaria tabescens TaxID=1929756 RepID=A0AA39N7R9_ARMTA|nr:uncharacterized protein EV420DRAFT_218594 [Desarmillaria tabescens]KAK0460591.1 hypothetical protein EV420DRAFT_218594 [Desarmillaria tabescens]
MAQQPESTTPSVKSLSSLLFEEIDSILCPPPQAFPVYYSTSSPLPVADDRQETSNTSDASPRPSSMVADQSSPSLPPSLVEVADTEAEISSTDDASEQSSDSIEHHPLYHRHLLSPILEGGSIIDDEPRYPPDEESIFDCYLPWSQPDASENPPCLALKERPPVPPRGDVISCLLPFTPLTGATAIVPPGYLQISGRRLPPPVDRPPFDEPLSPSLSSKGIIDFPYDFPIDDAPRSAPLLGRSDSESSRDSSSTDEVHSDSKVSTRRWKRLFRSSRKSSKVSMPPPTSLLESSTPDVSEFGAVESAESLASGEKQSSLSRNVLKKPPKKSSNLDVPSKSDTEAPLTSVTKVSRKFPGLLKLSAIVRSTDSETEHGAQPSLLPRTPDGSFPPTPPLSAHDLGKVNAFYAPVPILPTPRPPMTPKLPATPQVPMTPEFPSTPNIPPIPDIPPTPKMISSHKSTPSLRTAQSLDTMGSKSIRSFKSAQSSKSSRAIPPPKPAPTCELPPTPAPAIVLSQTSKEDKRNTIFFVIEPEWDQNSDDDVPFQFVPREAVTTSEQRVYMDVFSHRMSLRPRSVSNPELLAASVAKSLASAVEGAGY